MHFFRTHLLLPVLLLLVAACGEGPAADNADYEQAAATLNEAYGLKDYQRLTRLADEYEADNVISDVEANYWRGYACSRQRQFRRAEIFWKQAVASDIRTDDTRKYYSKSANRLANLLLLKGDYDGTLRVALPAIEKLSKMGGDSIGDFCNLLNTVACCQLKLNMVREAEANFTRAFVDYQVMLQHHPDDAHYKSAAVCLINSTTNYLTEKRFDLACQWAERFESLMTRYRERGQIDTAFLDKETARLELYKATALYGMDSTDVADEAYRRALETDYAKTADGKMEACDYLMAAGRWHEAARNFEVLDYQMQKYGMDFTLDNIRLYLLPKFKANSSAMRVDTSLTVAMKICNSLEDAINEQKENDMAELATIYETQQKEAQIAQQRDEIARFRLIAGGTAMLLLTIFFGIYSFHKRKAQQRLAAAHAELGAAHEKLQKAYAELETTTKAKARIDSELRIARNIQLSIVPSVFPEHKGLDLFASMVPAREVGGDLYDFIVSDNYLYFCIGDVSGKGVPAALFMAQTARMFRALAKEMMKHADIAKRLNEELTENNDSGMFVTMFLGLVNLKTGNMQFCNAGHNPPVIDGQFLEMESNAPIGLWLECKFAGEEIDNVKGKPMFFYTDGLNEAENSRQEQFGDDRMLSFVVNSRLASARQTVEAMAREVEKHRNGTEPNDDLTMLCMKVG